MSRALGIVAEAVAAVIAAEVQAQLNVTRADARAIGRASVAALVGDGWHITVMAPQHPPTPQAEAGKGARP